MKEKKKHKKEKIKFDLESFTLDKVLRQVRERYENKNKDNKNLNKLKL